MNCPKCGVKLTKGMSECECGWKRDKEQALTATSDTQAAEPKTKIKDFFKNDLFRAVILSVIAILLIRHAGFLAFGYKYTWSEGFVKFIVAINGVTRLLIILGAGFLSILAFLPALRLYRAKEKYSLIVFTLALIAILLSAITLISFLCTAVNNFTI